MIQRATHILGTAIRETALSIDRIGSSLACNNSLKEIVSKHRSVMSMYDKSPLIGDQTFVAPSATIVGQVIISPESSVLIYHQYRIYHFLSLLTTFF